MTEKSAEAVNPLLRFAARFDDGILTRWAFAGMLAGTIIVIGLDARALYLDRPGHEGGHGSGGNIVVVEPVLPPALGPDFTPTVDPRDTVTLANEALRQPIRFELRPGGIMSAEGSIDVGAARRLASELEERGEYVRVLSLNSPGGSLDDAMAMARLVRERGIATEVSSGALCASSCPLVLAGGTTRSAGDKAAVGLHQFYAAADSATGPAQAMSDAQATAARIGRYLIEMDVDAALWLHALDTPPQALYYLTPEEMRRYRLVNAPLPVAGG